MAQYFLRRLLLVIPTFLGITLLVFTFTRLVPGGPADEFVRMMEEQKLKSSAAGGFHAASNLNQSPVNEDQIKQLNAMYGLDKPILQAYGIWLWKILHFDLGNSIIFQQSVWSIIKSKFPVSIYYGVITTLLTYLISIPLGIRKALKHKKLEDTISSVALFVGYAVPGYVLGLILISLVTTSWHFFPLGGFTSFNFPMLSPWEKVKDIVWHSILPLICYLIGSFTGLTITMKNMLLENMAADYVRTAMAKGRTFKDAMWKHAFRNSIIPIASSLGGLILIFLSGSFLMESIFNIDGLGLLGYTALLGHDYPIMMGTLAITTFLGLIAGILSDFIVALVDPRVRYDK